MGKLFAAVDCGTSEIKTGIFDETGKVYAIVSRKYPCIFIEDGGIEQDPKLLVNLVCQCLRHALDKSRVKPEDIASLAVCNQRATILGVDSLGEPVGNVISWQDMRGKAQIDAFREQMSDAVYFDITGLPLHPVFSIGKFLWLKNCRPEVFKKIRRFVLIHDYLLKELGCEDYFSDCSNASLTGFFDVSCLRWSKELIDLLGITESRLSTIVPSGKKIGEISSKAANECGLLAGTPLISGGGDQQCAGIGAGAVEEGVIEITMGTAGVSLCCVDGPQKDPYRRVTCCAHAVPGKWCLEGLQNCAGAGLQWFNKIAFEKRNLPRVFFKAISEIKPGADGLLFYPYLSGSAAPYWNPQARGVLIGLTLAHNKASIARAVIEGVCMETKQIIDVFSALKIPINEIRLTGGCTDIQLWNQTFADILEKSVFTLRNRQASLLGAAILGAYGIGAFSSINEAVNKMVKIDKAFNPLEINIREYKNVFLKFNQILEKLGQVKIFENI